MTFAKPYKRIIAYLIEFALLVGFMCLVYFFLLHDSNTFEIIKDFYFDFKEGSVSFQELIKLVYDLTNKKTLLLFIIYLLYCFIYFVFMPIVFPFQTLGRFLMKIKVVKLNNTKLSFGTLFLREILGKGLFVIFSLGIVAVVSFFMMFFSRSGRSIHDRAANTVVVEA